MLCFIYLFTHSLVQRYLQTTTAVVTNLAEPILRPTQAPLSECPESLRAILSRSPSSNMNRKQVIKGWMRLPSIWPFQQIRHGLFPLRRRGRHRLLDGFVETTRVRKWSRISKGEPHIAQVVNCHAGDDDEDVLVSEARDCLAETVVLDGVFGVKERGLYNWDVEGVGVGFECCQGMSQWYSIYRELIRLTALETRPNTMIQPSLHPLGFDPSGTQRIKHLLRNFRTPDIRILLFIVMTGEVIETKTG